MPEKKRLLCPVMTVVPSHGCRFVLCRDLFMTGRDRDHQDRLRKTL